MKKIIISSLLIVVLVLVSIISCSKSTIIDMAIPRNIDTSVYTPRTRVDTTSKEDTTRVPISFTVDVEGWGPENIVKIN